MDTRGIKKTDFFFKKNELNSRKFNKNEKNTEKI